MRRCLALASLLLALSPSVFAADGGAAPCGTGPDYEPVETRCDGIDNDCDGLVDVLLPVAENACTDGSSCEVGHAACLNGQRACLAPGPSPEVLDGRDNDCNGVVDDVPPAQARARALLLVPGYAFSDAPLEVDDIASILDQWGIAYDRPSSPADFDAALPTLAQYPLVIVPGYLEEDFLVPFRQAALESYAQQGGVLVVFKPILAAQSSTQALIGTTSTARRSDVDAIVFDGPRSGATRAFDSPEEIQVPLDAAASGQGVTVHVLTPAGDTESLATATVGGVPVGSAVTRRAAGLGVVYALGHDLHTSFTDRCYVNCFEPAGDLAGLFLREAFREGTRGHVVLKHTVPGPEDSEAFLTHDLCALDAQQPGPQWGEPGALQVAAAEQKRGARGSFFATTQTVTTAESVPYYSPQTMQELCALGMCPVGAHSVVHGVDFATLAPGTCAETPADYTPDVSATLCGEVRVSLDLVADATGSRPVAWRSPYLDVNPLQYDALASQGILLDSSYAIGDLKSNLPVSLARTGTNQGTFHENPLYSAAIALEDGIGGTVDGVTSREEMSADNAAKFTTLWTYAMLRNADNGAHTLALLHPSYGLDQPHDNVRNKVAVLDRYLQACQQRGVRIGDTVADLVDFWRAREEASVDASYAAGGYDGTLTTGAHAARNLTLEFGDVITRFDCAACGAVGISGKRVTLAAIAPATTVAFRAVVGAMSTTPPAVPAAPVPVVIALVASLVLVGTRGVGRRAAVLVALLWARPALAETSPYCAKVRERAADDAALLMAPRLILQGLRFPANGLLEGGTIVGDGFQLRAGLVFSATDLYKGIGVREAGDADCREHDARVALEAAVGAGDDEARRAALEAQIAFLEAHGDEVRAWVDKAVARFSDRVITVVELEDVRARVGLLARKLVQARGQDRQLEAKLADRASARTADELAKRYADAAADLESAEARVRESDPFQLDMTAGIITYPQTDWYGIVQLGFNLGGLTRRGHAERYAKARREERARAPYEAEARLRQAQAVVAAAREQAHLELGLIERELEDLRSTRQVLEGSEAANIVHQRDRLALEQVELEAERVFYRAYVDKLGSQKTEPSTR